MTTSTPSTPAPTGAPGAVLLDTNTLATQVHRLADEIARDHPNGVVLIGVLKGSLIFLADLARAITDVAVTVDFLAISRYAPDSGRVRILMDLTVDITDRDVVIVEDLVDTGLTLAYLLGHVRGRSPARVEVCTLFDRPERRIVPLEPRYIGAELAGDAFVIGYGLHVGERYRNLPVVVRADPGVLSADPDAYLALYGAPEASKRRDARVDPRRAAP